MKPAGGRASPPSLSFLGPIVTAFLVDFRSDDVSFGPLPAPFDNLSYRVSTLFSLFRKC